MRNKQKITKWAAGSIAILGLGACAQMQPWVQPIAQVAMQGSGTRVEEAGAAMTGTKGNSISGYVQFKQTNSGVRVIVDVAGLAPGLHGLSVNEGGECGEDGSKSGPRYNPTSQPHGARSSSARKMGDLGNIRADNNGRAQADFIDPILKLQGSDNIVLRTAVIYANADDEKTQPDGNAGAKVSCGRIAPTNANRDKQ